MNNNSKSANKQKGRSMPRPYNVNNHLRSENAAIFKSSNFQIK